MPRPVSGPIVKRRPPLAILVPGLLLLGLMLLGAALLLGEGFRQPRTAAWWAGTIAFGICSTSMIAALLRARLRGSRVIPQGDYAKLELALGRVAAEHADDGGLWRFRTRWKEELACESQGGVLVLEMMFIEPHVYFPTDASWARQAPRWAKSRRADLLVELERWCTARDIPLSVDEQAYVRAL